MHVKRGSGRRGDEVVGKTRKRDANDPPERNHRSLKLGRRWRRSSYGSCWNFCEASADHPWLNTSCFARLVSRKSSWRNFHGSNLSQLFHSGSEYISINRCDRWNGFWNWKLNRKSRYRFFQNCCKTKIIMHAVHSNRCTFVQN